MTKDIYQYSEESLVKTLKSFLGNSQPVIKGYQGSPEPTMDYMVVTALDVVRVSTERASTKIGDDLTEYNSTLLRVMIDLTAYGETCYRLMQSALTGMEHTNTTDSLHYQYGFSLNTLGQIQRNPELRGTDYVQRCTATIELTTVLFHSQNIDWFDAVQFEGVYKVINGKVVLEENETVSANDT